jgi:hypothetical protein
MPCTAGCRLCFPSKIPHSCRFSYLSRTIWGRLKMLKTKHIMLTALAGDSKGDTPSPHTPSKRSRGSSKKSGCSRFNFATREPFAYIYKPLLLAKLVEEKRVSTVYIWLQRSVKVVGEGKGMRTTKNVAPNREGAIGSLSSHCENKERTNKKNFMKTNVLICMLATLSCGGRCNRPTSLTQQSTQERTYYIIHMMVASLPIR